jgi:hypothetical protein
VIFVTLAIAISASLVNLLPIGRQHPNMRSRGPLANERITTNLCGIAVSFSGRLTRALAGGQRQSAEQEHSHHARRAAFTKHQKTRRRDD